MTIKLRREMFFSANAILVYFALGKLLLHLATANNYGYFIDELYTIACGKHFAFGYVDIPPLAPWLSRLSGLTLGYSLFAVHVFPAFFGAATVFMAGLIARRLGGGRFAQALTALAVALGPMWLVMDSFFAYDSVDMLVMSVFLYLMAGLLAQEKPKLRQWIFFGIAGGIGLMTKGTMLFFGFAFLVGLLASPRRRFFTQPGLWLSGLIALAIFTPYLVWQGLHGWPVIEYWGIYGRIRTYHANPLEYFLMIFITMNPLAFPVWALGLCAFFTKPFRQYRTLGVMLIALFVMFAAVQAKFYMLVSAFIPLFAGGAVLLESFTSAARKWLRPMTAGLIALAAFLFLPLAVPLLPVESLVAYIRRFSFVYQTVKTDNAAADELPQYFADRFGWPDAVKTVAGVYDSLPPDDRAQCVILTSNYGNAGAVDLLGPAYGLPGAASGHLSYYFWGPGEKNGRVLITVGIPKRQLDSFYDEVEGRAVVSTGPYAMWYNRNLPVYVCRRPKFASFADIWPYVKHFD